MGDFYLLDGMWDAFFGFFYLLWLILTWGVAIAAYVFRALGMYTIAKRRGIRKPWLSWIPVGDSWILGSISDQYQYVAKAKVKNKRKALLVLQIISAVAGLAMTALLTALLLRVAGGYMGTFNGVPHFTGEDLAAIMSLTCALVIPALIGVGVSVAIAVISYIALYDVYRSCEPQYSVLYLVLSIVFDVAMSILLFVYRNHDNGMPPRKQMPEEEQAQQETEENQVTEEDFE